MPEKKEKGKLPASRKGMLDALKNKKEGRKPLKCFADLGTRIREEERLNKELRRKRENLEKREERP